MTGYSATVYSRHGCGKCLATAGKIKKMGVPINVLQIDEHPDKKDLMQAEDRFALPLVEVTTPDGEICRWNDMSTRDLGALEYLVKEDAE